MTTTLTIRIPDDLKAEVAEAARKDDRSVTSFIVKALRDALLVEGSAEAKLRMQVLLAEARGDKPKRRRP